MKLIKVLESAREVINACSNHPSVKEHGSISTPSMELPSLTEVIIYVRLNKGEVMIDLEKHPDVKVNPEITLAAVVKELANRAGVKLVIRD